MVIQEEHLSSLTGSWLIQGNGKLYVKSKISILYGDPEVSRDFDGFDNEVFTVRPYCWDDDKEKAELPNFVYKPTGFEIKWYKYAFRDSYMNQNLAPLQILDIFKNVVKT